MGPVDLVLAPLRAAQLGLRALEDLNAVAERARREPDPVEEVRERLDALQDRLDALLAVATLIEAGGRDLTSTAKDLRALTMELIVGGRDLTETARSLDGTSRELHDGGEDLTATAKRLDGHLRTVLAAMPRLLEGLDAVDALEGAVETVADTVEPLQGAAERVGRVTQRFSRS